MRHQHISFIKSIIRMIGYLMLLGVAPVAGFVLLVSELLGIIEEIGHE
jgi:hypothetical protein